MPTHEEIRKHRLLMAIEKLEAMKPSKIRDTLIQDFERMIGSVHLAASNEGQGAREGSPSLRHGRAGA